MSSVYDARRQRLRAAAAALGADNIIITDPINVRYLTGEYYFTMERFLALVLNAHCNEGFLVLPLMEAGRMLPDCIMEKCYADSTNAEALVASLCTAGAKTALEKSHLSLGRAELLIEHLGICPGDCLDVSPVLQQLRMRKDQNEVELLQACCQFSDEVLAEWRCCLQPGVPQTELHLELKRISARRPEFKLCPDAIISVGSNTSTSHGLSEPLALKPRDVVWIDFGHIYHGYNSDCTRTFFIGEPDAEAARLYNVVYQAQTAAVAAVRPGVCIGDIDRVARDIITAAGYGNYFTHRTGHGLGLSIHEEPYARADNCLVLQEGMVFTIEPGIYLPGQLGIRIEDDVLVTASGAHIFNAAPKRLEDNIIM